jgi:hypothetical protein
MTRKGRDFYEVREQRLLNVSLPGFDPAILPLRKTL